MNNIIFRWQPLDIRIWGEKWGCEMWVNKVRVPFILIYFLIYDEGAQLERFVRQTLTMAQMKQYTHKNMPFLASLTETYVRVFVKT